MRRPIPKELVCYGNLFGLNLANLLTGLMGPYAMAFTRSGIPDKNLDTSFFSGLSISGYVPASSRGQVSGTAYGVSTSYRRVVYWFNR